MTENCPFLIFRKKTIMIEEDQDLDTSPDCQCIDVDVDIDDPDIRLLIDEYRKPKAKPDDAKSVRAAVRIEERQKARQERLQTLQCLEQAIVSFETGTRRKRPEECLLCKASFKDVCYRARGLCRTCYWRYRRLRKLDPELAAQKSSKN